MNQNILIISLNLAKKVTIWLLVFAVISSILTPINLAQAIDPLVISSVEINQTDKNATITWLTNRKTTGKIEYGLAPNDYTWSVNTNLNLDNHAITISGLFPETDYFFRITAEDNLSVVQSSELVFETLKAEDNKVPTISKVTVAYLTGSTATIQWETDEDATSEVLFGLTESYGKVKTDNRLKRIHDITLTGLVDATTYQFRVQSKDKDHNTARWFNSTFRTKFGTKLDDDELIIFNITPVSENDINVTETSAVISWRTNKLSEATVRYSTSPNPGAAINTNPPRDFAHNVTIAGLNPGTTYYYDISAKDVFGEREVSQIFSFKTKFSTTSTNADDNLIPSSGSNQGIVLGASNCSINLQTDFGYYGAYYNHSSEHPDMNIPAGSSWSVVGRDNNWYDNQYFSFDRIDPNLNFLGNFFPFKEAELLGDPNHFAVNWRAMFEVKQSGNYSYTIASDDDSWVFIDGNLVTNLGGLHMAINQQKTITLSAGYHELEIFYADRRGGNATFRFLPDARLILHPLPLGCRIQDILDFNNSGGTVLGVSNDDDSNFGTGGESVFVQPTYACNPGLGYTKIKALYKTSASPDIWALLETGQKHYITSPESFNLYQCDWSQIKTVSQSFLNSFNNATLVRTPDNSTIYHLFDRPVVQWLKINIPSPSIFVSYEDNFWGNVARINHLDIASYPDAQLIKEENGSTIYLIEGNTKRAFGSPSVFDAQGYDWIEVVALNQAHLDSYLTSETIQ